MEFLSGRKNCVIRNEIPSCWKTFRNSQDKLKSAVTLSHCCFMELRDSQWKCYLIKDNSEPLSRSLNLHSYHHVPVYRSAVLTIGLRLPSSLIGPIRTSIKSCSVQICPWREQSTYSRNARSSISSITSPINWTGGYYHHIHWISSKLILISCYSQNDDPINDPFA